MSTKAFRSIAIGIAVLFAWYWVAWPALSFLQVRNEIEGVASWDLWKPLFLGPIDSEARSPEESALQLAIQTGNWLFGYLLIVLAVVSPKFLLQEKEWRDSFKLMFAGLLIFVVVILVVGARPTSQSDGLSGSGKLEQSEYANQEECSTVGYEDPPRRSPWSPDFARVLWWTYNQIESGKSPLSFDQDVFLQYSEWSSRATNTASYFSSVLTLVPCLESLFENEFPEENMKDNSRSYVDSLGLRIENALTQIDEFQSCAKSATGDGTCNESLREMLRKVRKVEIPEFMFGA